ncbi:hypothetical protein CYMTET_41264 [Cymbomonas tetramitiformis]|uniref:VCBS repeat-containing protein n=1 Tax=Cymbomonas tetramitiformis TaxID=36881 RepID=A0AAE0C7V4_9CHLO|nr:hypothetical protein CYMTET_41264 [Cymbomonas tetramitiformis]
MHMVYKYDTFYDNYTTYQYKNHSHIFACVAVVASTSELSRYTIRRINELHEDTSSYTISDNIIIRNALIRPLFIHDVNKDGFLDLAIGTQGNFYDCENSCDKSGGIYVVYGTDNENEYTEIAVRDSSDGTSNVNNSYGYNFVWDIHGDDVDGDGDIDLVVALKPNSTSFEIHLYLYEEDKTYSSTTIVLHSGLANSTELQPVMLRMVDIDQDGLKDVVYVSTTPLITAWHGDSENSYVKDLNYEVFCLYRELCWVVRHR